jgi:hypothetical protein
VEDHVDDLENTSRSLSSRVAMEFETKLATQSMLIRQLTVDVQAGLDNDKRDLPSHTPICLMRKLVAQS